MFFDMDLLCRQRQGKFGLIWLAATRGITTLQRRDVDAVNIARICNEILKYVMSQSTSPKDRLSLYLSGTLLYGTVLIYKQQVNNFQQTVVTYYCSIKRPLLTIDCDKGKPRKKNTTRSKKPKPNEFLVTTQAEQIRACARLYEKSLEGVNSNIIDPFNITLRDVEPGLRRDTVPDLFGDEGERDQQIAQFCGDNWQNIPDAPIPDAIIQTMNVGPVDPVAPVDPVGPVDPVAPVAPEPTNEDIYAILPAPPTTPRKRPVVSPEESPSKRKKTAPVAEVVEAQIHQPDVSPRSETQSGEMPPPRRPPIRRRLIRSPRPININVESPTRWHRTRLDRPVLDLETFVPKSNKRIGQVDDDPKDIIALLLAGVPHDDTDVMSIVRGAQDNNSVDSVRANLTAVDNTTLGLGLGRTIEPIAEQNIQIEELNALQLDNIVPSPRFSEILRENQREIHVDDIPPPRLHASTPKPSDVKFETAIIRQMNLLERIRALFLVNGNGPLGLDQLCDNPTKRKIATIFYDLLCLHSKQYIKLTHVPETVELGNIYPGEKLM